MGRNQGAEVIRKAKLWKDAHQKAAQNPSKLLSSIITTAEAGEIMQELETAQKELVFAINEYDAGRGGIW